MQNNNLSEKLLKAYRSMLDHVEDLVDKEKKPLKEALEEAEEKLSEWKELSREEIEHISEELKSNLYELGETSNQLRDSLNDIFKEDAAYIANSLWDKLTRVADKTIVELSEFNQNLQRYSVTDASTHSEQQQNWLKDADEWLSDYDSALKQLTLIRATLRKQLRAVNRYTQAVLKDETDQELHDQLSQTTMEQTSAVKTLHNSLIGDQND